MMIDRREAIEKSKTMKRTIFYLFCIGGLTVSSAVAQKRTVSHETGTFVGESSAERPERRVSVSPDDSFLDNTTLNGNAGAAGYEMFRSAGYTGSAGKDYLILSTPEFEEAVRRLADWKRTLGFGVHTRLRGDWTPEHIKSAVKEVYRSAPSLYYLLIVGDHDDVPAEDMARTIVNQDDGNSYQYVTDYYYGCMDGEDDVLADLYRGRLPVSTATEAMTVVDKIIRYERNPVRDTAFYDTGLHCAYFEDCTPYGWNGPGDGIEDKRFTLTSEEVRNYMLSKGKAVNRVYFAYDYRETDDYPPPTFWNNGEFAWGDSIPVELQRPYFAWDGDSADIVRYIDEGAFYVLYRGHGTDSTWVQPYFTGDNILSLANGDRLPVIFSINCETGSFQEDDCFAEAFLQKRNGGAIAVYAATEKSWPGYNDAMVIGMFDAIWPDPGVDSKLYNFLHMTTSPSRLWETTRLGEILDQGLRRMEETWGAYRGHIYTQFSKEIFHCFGDPGMRIYTDTPTEFEKFSVTRDSLGVRVDLGSEAGDIAFYDERTEEIRFYTGRSAEYSGDARYVRVCVSGQNKVPAIDFPVYPDVLYIQNETVQGPKYYKADTIKVGSHVTDEKAKGEAVFDKGEVTLTGREKVILDRGTTVKRGTTFKIQIKK